MTWFKSFFKKLKLRFINEPKCNCNSEDMDVDLANRVIQEMWNKEERYYKSINK